MRLIRVIRTFQDQLNSWLHEAPSWEDRNSSVRQGVPHTSWNSKNYYLFTKACYFFPSWGIRIQHTPSFSIFKIHFIIVFPPTNALIFCSSLDLGDQFLHKYKGGGKTVFHYVVIFDIWLSLRKTKDSVLNWANSPRISSALNFFVQVIDLCRSLLFEFLSFFKIFILCLGCNFLLHVQRPTSKLNLQTRYKNE